MASKFFWDYRHVPPHPAFYSSKHLIKLVSSVSSCGFDLPDSIFSRFQSLSCSLAERSALLQKAIAQSQSVQESLENLLQSMREVEQNLEGEQVASLSSGVIQEVLANNMVRFCPECHSRGCVCLFCNNIINFEKVTGE